MSDMVQTQFNGPWAGFPSHESSFLESAAVSFPRKHCIYALRLLRNVWMPDVHRSGGILIHAIWHELAAD
jgi:hypothetical protein